MADNPQFDRLIRIASTKNVQQTYSYGTCEFTWQALLVMFREKKDWTTYQNKMEIPAIMAGPLTGNRAIKNAVSAIELLISDHDDGLTMTESEKIAREHGNEAFIYPSFRNGTTEVVIKHDDFLRWAKKTGGTAEISDERGRAYFNDTGKLLPAFADKAVFQGKEQRDEGIVHVFSTDALDKHRVVRPLKSSIVFLDYVDANVSQAHAIEAWSRTYVEALDALGTTYDPACKDVTRRFFLTALPEGAPENFPDAIHVQGDPIDLTEIYQRQLDEVSAGTRTRSRTRPKSTGKSKNDQAKVVICEGHNLTAWAGLYVKTFDIERVMEESNLVLGEREKGGCFVQCHQSGHSGGEQETFVANGHDGKGFTIHCSGSTGGCCDLDRLEHLKAYIEADFIEIEWLFDPDFGGGEISKRVLREKTERETPAATRYQVKDEYNRGIDVKIFLEKTAGALNLDELQARAKKAIQIAGGVDPDDLKSHIKNGALTVADLIACAHQREEPSDDYDKDIFNLAKLKTEGEVTSKVVDEGIERVKRTHKTTKRAVIEDLAAEIERKCAFEKSLGALEEHEVKRLSDARDYNEQFAIMNAGGRALVLNMYETKLSQSLMVQDDFKKLYKDDYTTSVDEKGKVTTIYHAEHWLQFPEEGVTNFYRKGMIFQPPSSKKVSVSPEAYNLYADFLIKPDPSGSWGLFKELLNEVWVQGNVDLLQWVTEWFMHPLKFPGDKAQTALAIRGMQGDGKSFVTEKLMAPIYGDMLLRPTNEELIAGHFNEALAGKLMIALEEATFAGKKRSFNNLKEIITGDTVVINAKYKSPITLKNFARVILVSNQEHFLHIEPGDRRYTVLNSAKKWPREKFEALMDQWANGGAARFVYDAMNHEFRKLPNSQRLVISEKMETEYKVSQRAESRNLLERFLVSFLLRGNYSAADINAHHTAGHSTSDGHEEKWQSEKTLSLSGPQIEDAVKEFFVTHARQKLEHVPTLTTIVNKMKQFYGSIEKRRDSIGGGKKGPTKYVLPERRNALFFARKNDLITSEEHETAINWAGVQQKKIAGYAVLTPGEKPKGANGYDHPTDPGE